MQKKICYSCFREIDAGSGKCPYCGYPDRQNKKEYPFALAEGTVLNGNYIVGRMLGHGGFSITYLVQDSRNTALLSVKEYYPDIMTVRTDGCTVSAYPDQYVEDFAYGKECFMEEAGVLAELKENPNIVHVQDFFMENGTAYMVMDYTEGVSFRKYLEYRGTAISWEEAKHILFPVMDAVSEVHEKGRILCDSVNHEKGRILRDSVDQDKGIVFRDISLDSIIISKDGRAMLSELGSAGYSLGDRSCSLDVVLKHGFAPKEQYTRHDRQGAYTEVYSLAATMYYAITLRIPPASIDRFEKDELIRPSSLGLAISPEEENALLKALAVRPEDRYRTMAEFKSMLKPEDSSDISFERSDAAFEALDDDNDDMHSKTSGVNDSLTHDHSYSGDKEQKLPKRDKENENRKDRKKWLIPVVAVAIVVVILVVEFGGRKEPDRSAYDATSPEKSEAVSVSEISVAPVNTTINVMAATEDLSGKDFNKRAEQYFWGQRDYQSKDVKTVNFQNSLDGVPQNAWDVSKGKDRSVLAWMDGSDLHVAAEGNIAPNPDASYMFAYFTNLTRIDFGNCFDTSGVENMYKMFYTCESLTSLDVSSFDTGNVTDMVSMFYGCESLTSLDVSSFDTGNVTDMGWMFCECSSLISLDVSCFDTGNVTDMESMFFNCESLTNLDVSRLNTENVKYMGNMFFGCYSLTRLDVSNFDTDNVTNMSSMFETCSSLTSLDVSNFDTGNVTDMSSMFELCSSLTSLDVSSFDTGNVTNMSSMFGGCSSLISLDVSSFDTGDMTDMSWMFFGCDQLTQLNTTDEKILSEYKKR